MLVLTDYKNIQSGNVAQILSDTLTDRTIQSYEKFDNIIVIARSEYDGDVTANVYKLDDYTYTTCLFATTDESCIDDALSSIETWADQNDLKLYFETTGAWTIIHKAAEPQRSERQRDRQKWIT